ncbi:MAG: hypothetical protein J6U92_02570 [Clostridia bacterium]|nr:hypothetical protein [Clostridia bacterium]
MKKRFISILLVGLLSFTCFYGCAPEQRSDISYLYVRTYEGGFGDKYLNDLKIEFESRYKNESFAEGKTGVVLDIRSSPDIGGSTMLGKIKNDKSTQVYIMEALYYSQYTDNNLLYDLSSIVKEDLADGTGTIESKLYDDQKASLTAVDGKYYSLPTFAGMSGITYNAQLFEDKFLFFADEDGYYPSETSSYTGKEYTGRGFVQYLGQTKSCGPNGIYENGLGDDGLPSSYEEFFYLFDYMLTPGKDITPIIWSGDASHYTNYVYQALISATSTKAEFLTRFNFDSGNNNVRLVESFNGDEPVITNGKITPDVGYKVRQMYPDYLALRFMEHLFENKGKDVPSYYDPRSVDLGLSNTAAQKLYINSTLNDRVKDIACLIEGAYWYNEASKDIQDAANSYGELGKNINFRYMPMPAKEYGTVNENQGTVSCAADAFYYYLGVNNNIKGNEELEKLAKAFVKFFYEKENLATVTVSTGIPMAVKYDISKDQYNAMDNFEQSLWDTYKTALSNDTYVTPMSTSKIFLNNVPRFTFKTSGYAFDSNINGANVSIPQKQFYNGNATAKTYFEGMVTTIKGTWNTTYYTGK